jgi:hypothetical protein
MSYLRRKRVPLLDTYCCEPPKYTGRFYVNWLFDNLTDADVIRCVVTSTHSVERENRGQTTIFFSFPNSVWECIFSFPTSGWE